MSPSEAVQHYIDLCAAERDAATAVNRPGRRLSVAEKNLRFEAYCDASSAREDFATELGVIER
jgi:uncharacterized protein (DUF2126 family)